MLNKSVNLNQRIGILGGGQLGKMIIQEAVNFNFEISILDGDPNASCSKLASEFSVGSITDYDTVLKWGEDKDLISVEIENVSIEALEVLESMGKRVFPQPRVLKIIKDKGVQKQFYRDHGIPTADFHLIDNKEQLTEYVHFLPFAQKLRTGGYDGKGVQVIRTEQDITDGFDSPSVLEEFVPFQKELATIVARNERGEIAVYPMVECEFSPEANLVEFLFSPAEVSSAVEEEGARIAKEIITKLDMVGLLAVEYFLTTDGKLLVNEIAPRPHNSGHHTIECNVTSQFEQFVRAIVNFPLGATALVQPGVMINLLGERNFSGIAHYPQLDEALSLEGVHVHLYGKKHTKPFRKMGHITVCHEELEVAKKRARSVKSTFKVVSQ